MPLDSITNDNFTERSEVVKKELIEKKKSRERSRTMPERVGFDAVKMKNREKKKEKCTSTVELLNEGTELSPQKFLRE